MGSAFSWLPWPAHRIRRNSDSSNKPPATPERPLLCRPSPHDLLTFHPRSEEGGHSPSFGNAASASTATKQEILRRFSAVTRTRAVLRTLPVVVTAIVYELQRSLQDGAPPPTNENFMSSVFTRSTSRTGGYLWHEARVGGEHTFLDWWLQLIDGLIDGRGDDHRQRAKDGC